MFGSEIGHNVAALVLLRVERDLQEMQLGKFGRLTRFRNNRNQNGAHRLVLVSMVRNFRADFIVLLRFSFVLLEISFD